MNKLDRNNTNIIKILNEELKKKNYNNTSKILKDHQYIIKEYIKNIDLNDTKGIILVHGMGSGKTILSISIALESDNDVIIFINASLISNYINDIIKYLKLIKYKKNINEYIKKKFIFITLNAFNLHKNIPLLKNKLIIIDESHNLVTGILNGGKNYLELYKSIRNENDVKVILMSGTPIQSDPYELMINMNLLCKNLIFPENYNDFIEYYRDAKENNKELYNYRLTKLENRIIGMISYYENVNYNEFPADLGIKIIKCKMTKSQTNNYITERNIENEQIKTFKLKSKLNTNVTISKPQQVGSYKVKSRLLCNRFIEEDVLLCEKFNKIYENILLINGIALVYSQFINNYGLNGFSDYLLKKNYELYNINKIHTYNISKLINNNNMGKSNNTPPAKLDDITLKKKFAIIKGDISFEDRNKIQTIFNSPENINGNLINILLISSSGAEGLDLKYIRSIHILESYWNYSRILQIKGRGIRYKSHELLPEAHRNVQTFVYLSTLNSTESTSDEEIYNKSIDKIDFINDFINIIKRVSVDCMIYSPDNCITCDVLDKKLFSLDFNIDINLNNPCNNDNDTEIEVTHVKNDIYYDKKNNVYYKLINNQYIKI